MLDKTIEDISIGKHTWMLRVFKTPYTNIGEDAQTHKRHLTLRIHADSLDEARQAAKVWQLTHYQRNIYFGCKYIRLD